MIGNITGSVRPVIQKLEPDHNSVYQGKGLCASLDQLSFILSYTSALSYVFKRKYFSIVKSSDAWLAEKLSLTSIIFQRFRGYLYFLSRWVSGTWKPFTRRIIAYTSVINIVRASFDKELTRSTHFCFTHSEENARPK